MIISIGFTQFVLLSLGILALNVLLKAGGFAENVADTFPQLAVQLGRQGLWIYLLPLAWVAFATICVTFKQGWFNPSLARWSGVGLTVAIAGVYFYAATTLF